MSVDQRMIIVLGMSDSMLMMPTKFQFNTNKLIQYNAVQDRKEILSNQADHARNDLYGTNLL